MLFLVIARHSAEMCPGGIVRPDKDFFRETTDNIKKAGVKLIEGYIDAPSHVFYFVLDADDNKGLNNAVEQLRLIGEVKIRPVMKFSDSFDWAKAIGIQE